MRSAPTIIGGGIAGIATAIALRPHFNDITVLEQAAAPNESGAGIQVGPHTVTALRRLGAAERLDAVACRPGNLVVRNGHTGKIITKAPLGRWIEDRYGAPYMTMARADLLDILLQRAGALDLAVEYDARITEVRRISGGFALEMAGGRRDTASMVGADGLWSKVRAGLRPSTKTLFSGQTAWRATLDLADVPETVSTEDVTLWLAPACHAVHYPMSAGRRLNLAVFTEGMLATEGWDTTGDRDDLLARLEHRGLAPALFSVINAARGYRKWPMFEIEPATVWGSGPATLVGDAAHPMLPYLAQGAAMAVEDALALGAEFSKGGGLETVFRRYELHRGRRVAKVQRAARANAGIFHANGPTAMARNAALMLGEKLLSGSLIRRYGWLYGGP